MVVEDLLAKRWSPEQISAHLKDDFVDDDSMHVVPETIYQTLFVQTRGGLNKELTKYLRTHRKRRQPHTRTVRNAGQRSIVGKVMISERPAEIEDRAVPGHWEGDLIIGGQGLSQAGTLVERTTGLLLIVQLPDDRTAPTVAAALQRQIATLPTRSCQSITWDQGIEMAAHASFTIATGIPVYFCEPHSPWQRGSNENTNGLIRDYLPHGMDLSTLSQADLDDIADEINNRPRKRHGFRSPLNMFNQLALH
jgi:IS30 family transposase